jgi:cytosolic 5'-nucleotidase 3
MKNIIINNPVKFQKLKKQFIKDGKNKLHLISDFDRTLTNAYVNSKFTPSILAIIRDENIFCNIYSKKANKLFNYYHKFEIDSNIPLKRKIKLMENWWNKSAQLFIDFNLNKKNIKKIIKSNKIKLRDKTDNLIKYLNLNNIPLIIFSASSIGNETINYYLKFKKLNSNNIFIFSNKFIWDKKGIAIGYKKPLIHAFNKNEFSLEKYSFFNKIKNRKNVILLGDSLGDINMNQKFNYDNILKIGFLNFNIKNDLEKYKKNYDIVILNDGSMEFVYELLKKIK